MRVTNFDARPPGVGAEAGTATIAPARDPLRRVPPLPAGQRSCCCPARAFVRVLVPAGGTRAAPSDLYLCAHHFRAGRTALTRIGAVAFDGHGAEMTSSSPVFLTQDTPARAEQTGRAS
jgi:hypothetical protein